MSRTRSLTVGMLLLTAACSQTAPPPTSQAPPTPGRTAGTPLSVTLDGGYAFIQQADGTMTVDSLNSHHPMVLWLDTGSVEGEQPPQARKRTWKLDQKKLSLDTQVAATTEVQLPPVREVPQPADSKKCTADPARGSALANNGFYWPELNQWIPNGRVAEDTKSLNGQVALHGGSLTILGAGGCYQINDPTGKVILHRPMVLGTQSIQFKASLANAKLTITLEALQGGQPAQTFTLLPDASGRIDLLVKHEDWGEKAEDQMPLSTEYKQPKSLPDFDMFLGLLGLPQGKHYTLSITRHTPQVHPGDECIPGFFSLKPGVPPYVDPPPPAIVR